MASKWACEYPRRLRLGWARLLRERLIDGFSGHRSVTRSFEPQLRDQTTALFRSTRLGLVLSSENRNHSIYVCTVETEGFVTTCHSARRCRVGIEFNEGGLFPLGDAVLLHHRGVSRSFQLIDEATGNAVAGLNFELGPAGIVEFCERYLLHK